MSNIRFKNKTKYRLISSQLVLAACMVVIPHANAQDAPAAATEPAPEGEILVTARRREERLQDVPLAITAITDQQLKTLDIRDTVALANFTPGLQLTDAAFGRNDRGSARPLVMRGLSLANGSGVTAGALVFLDGAPLIGGEVPVSDDIARVEVLRGPQSVYFGRSTLSGAVSYTTKGIGDEWHGYAGVKVASYGTRDIEASISGPVSDGFGIRLSGRTAQNNGYYQSEAPGHVDLGARKSDSISLTVEGKPSDTLSVKLYTSYFNYDDGLSANAYVLRSANTCNLGGARLTYCGELPSVGGFPIWTNSQVSTGAQNTIYSGTLLGGSEFDDKLGTQRHGFLTHAIVNWDFSDFATLSVINAYHRDKYVSASDGLYADPAAVVGGIQEFHYSFGYDTTDFSSEARLNSRGNGPLRWTAGVSYVDTKQANQSVLFYTDFGGGTRPGSNYVSSASKAKALGFFGGLYYTILPGLTLSGEGRYQIDDRADVGGNSIVAGIPVAGVELSKKFRSFSPRMTIDYKLTPSANIFASYATGTRPGGFNRLLINARADVLAALQAQAVDTSLAYDEEKLEMYEAGIKSSFLNRRLFTNLTAYYGTLKNQQVQVSAFISVPANPALGLASIANSFTITNNIGRTRVYGLEFDGSFRVNRMISIGMTGAYNETKIKDYSCVACAVFTGSKNVTGNHLPNAPRFTGSLTFDAKDSIGGSSWDWTFHTDYAYRGKIFVNEINKMWLGDRHLVNLRVGVERQGIAVEAFVSNLLQDKTATSAYQSLDGRYGLMANYTSVAVESLGLPEPRIFGGRVRYNF
jgi:iron complex outermembrane receptor protein